MLRFRSVLALILAAVTTLLVSCSSPTPVAKGPIYSADQLAQIQHYSEEVASLRDRLIELPPLVQKQQWTDVESFIHGPLGELRARMSRLARSLEPKAQAPALDSAKEVFKHLNLIDEAAQSRDTIKALRNYNETLRDFEAFFKLIPAR